MLSIIVPTLNEENHLPSLLRSIKRQGFSDCQIIVADAGSKDRTSEIARRYNCKIVPGGSPARGRNSGARVAKGNLLLFLDADVVLPEGFLEKGLKEFKRKKLQIATFRLLPQRNDKAIHLLFDLCYNLPVFFMQKTLAHAAMGILIEKELFEKIRGFDETIKIAEDHDLARRAEKIGRYGVIRSTELFVSERRFEKEGWFRTAMKYLLCGAYMLFKGPIRKDTFEYKFSHYSKDKENEIK